MLVQHEYMRENIELNNVIKFVYFQMPPNFPSFTKNGSGYFLILPEKEGKHGEYKHIAMINASVSVDVGIFNPLYTCRLFHWYMVGESICHFRGVGSISAFLFYL